jgi:hypothetical protein
MPQAGVLGAAGTSVVFGNNTVNDHWRSGVRLSAGYWFDPLRSTGIEAQFFILGRQSTDFTASSGGNPILAQPFLNAFTGFPDTSLIAFPGVTSGSVAVHDTSRLLGAGAAYRMEFCRTCAFGSVGGLIGYRYLRLQDSLANDRTNLDIVGDLISTIDQFDTVTLSMVSISGSPAWSPTARGSSAGSPRSPSVGPSRMSISMARPSQSLLEAVPSRVPAACTRFRQISEATAAAVSRLCLSSPPR